MMLHTHERRLSFNILYICDAYFCCLARDKLRRNPELIAMEHGHNSDALFVLAKLPLRHLLGKGSGLLKALHRIKLETPRGRSL